MDEIICEGFLTKSPPEKKINRARWHQRWFVLRRLRGEYILEYYKDRNSVTPKGTIHLENCEQVDQGLTFETKKFHDKAYIFDIVTSKRKYFLVARSEEDMIRWVRSVCEVCGFHLEGDEPNEEDGVQTQPMTIHHPPQESISNLYTDEPLRSTPIHSNGNLEDGYFELSNSVTGPNGSTTDGDLGKGAKISGRDSGVATLDEPIDRQSFGSSGSSLPGDSAPPPPPKTPTNRRTSSDEDTSDIYDTPPVHQSQRHSFVNDSIYDCPPAFKRRPSQPVEDMDETESLYKQVPAPRRSVTSSIDFPVSPMKNGFEPQDMGPGDIYDVPPVSRELPSTKQVYDTPPANFVVKHDELSQSTDNLAKTFQNISFRNSMGSHSITSESFDLYDIPSSPLNSSLNDSGQFSSLSSHDRGPVSPPMDAAPPRPPKPTHMQALDPTTPPPSFDDTYNIPLNLLPQSQLSATDLTKRLSQEAQGQISDNYETPPSWSHGGHSWTDNKSSTAPRYINAKRTESTSSSGMPVNQQRVRSSLDGTIPAPSPDSYVNVRNERYTFSPKQTTQSCYLPMQGNSSFDFSDEPYMPMEGSIDGMGDSYTFMSSPSSLNDTPPPIGPRSKSVSSRNSQGEIPPPIPRSLSTSSRSSRSLSTSSRNSQGEVPPPVNRHAKPLDRRSTSSGIGLPDLTAATGAGSFYATPEDAYEVQGSVVASPRTKSFSKIIGMPMMSVAPKSGDSLRDSLLQDNFRHRTNTGGSTTSSSGESGVGVGTAQESHYVTPTDGLRQPTMTDEIYVYKDPPPLTPKLEKAQAAALQNQAALAPKDPPTFEAIAEANIPPPAPEEIVDIGKIEYLELDHTKNEEPPPRPPKPIDDTTVQYFDLDAKKTKALQDVTEERQKDLSNNKST